MTEPPVEPPASAAANVRPRETRSRRVRTWVSAALLLGGTAAFVVSLALPAVTKQHSPGGTIHLDGWTCATNYGPTAANNWFLGLAFVVWGAAVWLRWPWAWWIGVGESAVATLMHAGIGAIPGCEGIERLHSGYWTWLAATAVVCASFLVLPRPIRTEEGLTRPDVDRARHGYAWVVGVAAIAVLLWSHFLLPVPIGSLRVPGPVPDDAPDEWYQNGPTRSGAVTTMVQVTRPDGTTVDLPYHYATTWAPLARAHFGLGGGRSVFEFAALSLPLIFVAAAHSRRRAWRWSGVVVAGCLAAVAVAWVEPPWPASGITPHPTDVVWWATMPLFVAAFALVPPRR